MFWAAQVSQIKAVEVAVPEGFVLNVCNATLASRDEESSVSLGVEAPQMDKSNWKGVVCHLGADKGTSAPVQTKLDLVFGATPKIKFFVSRGEGKVNLTGYFQPGPPSDWMPEAEAIPAESKASVAEAKPSVPKKASADISTSTSGNNKKRAREEEKSGQVTWDQSDSSDSEEISKPAAPTKKASSVESTPTPSKPTPSMNGTKKNKKKRKKNVNKKTN